MDNYKNKIDIDCSIVVPFYNEAELINELYDRLTETMSKTALCYELIFVDDGSSDNTLQLLKDIASKDNRVLVIELRRNFGQTAALAAGLDSATGQIVISMDGDLQHCPEDIPNFLQKIQEGYDVVSGWRKERIDNLITRRIPSRMANWIASKITGVNIHDFGTTFKAYKHEIIEQLNLYGEMHRFIPALLSHRGAKITEIPIKNMTRPKGESNYGISRTFRVAFDLITIGFLVGYITRPLHFFGRAALYCFLAALLMVSYVLYDKLVYNVPIMAEHAPLTGLAALLFLIGFIFIATGLLAEIISRVYFEATNKTIYSIHRIHRRQNLTSKQQNGQ